MIDWNLIKSTMNTRMKAFSFRSEEDFAEFFATTYDSVMLSTATSKLGDKFLSGNKQALTTMWVLAYKMGKTGRNSQITKNIEKLFNKGLYLYWSTAIFTPSVVAPTNIIVNAGVPNIKFPKNSNSSNAFMNLIIAGLKVYHNTIVGTGWIGVI